MNLPNLKLATPKCCASCKWFKCEYDMRWCGFRRKDEEYEFMFDDFCDVREGTVMVCNNWESKL